MEFSALAAKETSALLTRVLGTASEASLERVEALRAALDSASKALEAAIAAPPNFERDVDEERLTVAPLLLVDTMAPEELEPVYLDDHPTTAAATVRASTCSRTSCARKIVAPRS